MVVVQMDHRLDLITVIDQSDVTSERNIAMAGRGRRQLAIKIRRRIVHSLPQIFIEGRSLMETRFLLRG